MSQGFQLKYNQLHDNDPTDKDAGKDERYAGPSHVREVCFVLPNGYRISLNYVYLVFREYFPEEGRIVLSFTSHTITLTGIYLEPLFYDFMQQLPRQIFCKDARYNPANEKDKPMVNEITVLSNNA